MCFPPHLCSVSSQNLTYEIILTLGQAFEVAYQLALQAQKSRPMAASAAEMIETKSSKPVPKPRVGMRKSAVRVPVAKTPCPQPPTPPWDLRAWGGAGLCLLTLPTSGPSGNSPFTGLRPPGAPPGPGRGGAAELSRQASP